MAKRPTMSGTPRVVPSGAADNSTLRWIVRANGTRGFLFVNNHQRLAALSPKDAVRFHLRWSDAAGGAAAALSVPSNHSSPVDVLPGAWFVWPFGIPLSDDAPGGPTLAWATAQLVARADDVVFLVETTGADPQVALD